MALYRVTPGVDLGPLPARSGIRAYKLEKLARALYGRRWYVLDHDDDRVEIGTLEGRDDKREPQLYGPIDRVIGQLSRLAVLRHIDLLHRARDKHATSLACDAAATVRDGQAVSRARAHLTAVIDIALPIWGSVLVKGPFR